MTDKPDAMQTAMERMRDERYPPIPENVLIGPAAREWHNAKREGYAAGWKARDAEVAALRAENEKQAEAIQLFCDNAEKDQAEAEYLHGQIETLKNESATIKAAVREYLIALGQHRMGEISPKEMHAAESTLRSIAGESNG